MTEPTKFNKPKPQHSIWDKHELVFMGNISNITGAMNFFELGSIRRIERKVKREDFIEQYVTDISAMFLLNDGQVALLKHFLSHQEFSQAFRYNETTRVEWANAVGLTSQTAHQYFRSLVSAKRLIKKLKRGHYRLNPEFIFHPSEIASADFLSLHISYNFEHEPGTVVVNEKSKVTLEHINQLLELYRKQQEDEKKIQSMFEGEDKKRTSNSGTNQS